MNTCEIAELKDGILNYLSTHSKKNIILEGMYPYLEPKTTSIEIVNECVKGMAQDEVINSKSISGERTILSLTDKGELFLSEGGYTKLLEKEIKEVKQQEYDTQKNRDKTDLEIENLKTSIENYKDSKTWAVIAIIISLLTLAYSIFFK